MQAVPLIDAHLEGFEPQDEQMFVSGFLSDPNYREQLTSLPGSYAGIVDGEVLIIAGVTMVYAHIGTSWAILPKGSEKNMVALTRIVKKVLDEHPAKRIETTVRRDFDAGHRWVKMLGFRNETPETGMKNYGVDGMTYDLYARYK
jgi:hypothetical protein